MADHAAPGAGAVSGWQLVAAFSTTSARGDERQLAQRVKEAIEALGLTDLQMERIEKALLEALARATSRQQPSDPASAAQVQIWTAPEYACGRGWGFFLVEKPGAEREGTTTEAGALVELFLYQELPS